MRKASKASLVEEVEEEGTVYTASSLISRER
jgi:hypothetical protein